MKISFNLCVFMITAHCVAGIPDGVKTTASILFTTASQTPETKKALLAGTIPPSKKYLPGTFCAAAVTTLVTNRVFQSTHAYKVLTKATQRIVLKYSTLPVKGKKCIMPGLSLAASSLFSMALFACAQHIAYKVEDEITGIIEKDNLFKDSYIKKRLQGKTP